MPDLALPAPLSVSPAPEPAPVNRFQKVYIDSQNRPVKSGQVSFYQGRVPILTVDLVNGALDVILAPGEYKVSAILRSVDNYRQAQFETVIVG